jgi:hypothetical protein
MILLIPNVQCKHAGVSIRILIAILVKMVKFQEIGTFPHCFHNFGKYTQLQVLWLGNFNLFRNTNYAEGQGRLSRSSRTATHLFMLKRHILKFMLIVRDCFIAPVLQFESYNAEKT